MSENLEECMTTPLLISKSNPMVRTIRLVASRSRRAPEGIVLAEGIRVLEAATHSACEIEAVLTAESFGDNARETSLLQEWHHRGIPIRRASGSLLKGLSDVIFFQGALALVRMPRSTLACLQKTPRPLLLCLCRIQDPGNLGTLLRTARATGVSCVCTIPGTVSVANPKAIRASAGACFSLPIVEALNPEVFVECCRTRRIPLYRADAGAKQSCWATDLSGSAAILLGNEARGLPESEWPGVSGIRVPMVPGVESLNVAAAGAMLLFEALRQRARNPSVRGIG
jgi:TrmH family RNA methyltransferase